MLHGLRRREHARVVNLTVLDLLHDILGFRQDSIHRIAAYGTRGHSTLIENSLQAFNLMAGLFAVFFKGAFEIGGLRALSHLRQVFIDLLFGVIDILERVQKQIVHRFDRHWALRELDALCAPTQGARGSSFCWGLTRTGAERGFSLPTACHGSQPKPLSRRLALARVK